MNPNDLSWHDGIFCEVLWSEKTGIRILLELYTEQIQSRTRNRVSIVCNGVKETQIKLDSIELLDNLSAGNISAGIVEDGILKIDLFGGNIRIHAESFEAKQLN